MSLYRKRLSPNGDNSSVGTYYADTSALVKRYVHEQGTVWVTGLTDPANGHELYTVRLAGPEMIAALFRRSRVGSITLADATRAAHNFRLDWQHQYLVLEVTTSVAERAMDLAEKDGLRGYDAVHLAVALEVESRQLPLGLANLVFVSADDAQRRAASTNGLLVENPNVYS